MKSDLEKPQRYVQTPSSGGKVAGWGHGGLLSSNLEQSIPFHLKERRSS